MLEIKYVVFGDQQNPNAENGRNNGKNKEPANDMKLNEAPAEKVYSGENNSWIVFGRDRPAGIDSGYGGKGYDNCGTIDIVAGRASALDISEVDGYINPNFWADASRIYISQRTDVDDNFKLCSGRMRSNGFAAIAIKSDDVRIIARNTLKIVTGTETKTSTNDNVFSTAGVQLIAGNDDSDLQPIPKGENLILALTSMVDDVHKLAGILKGFIEIQDKFNAAISKHTHISPFYAIDTIIPGGEAFKSGIETPLQIYAKIESGLNAFSNNVAKTKIQFIQNINSRYHFLN